MAQRLMIASNGRVFCFEQFPVRIGRGYDNELVVFDAATADKAALIDVTAEGLTISPVGGGNVYVDGEKLTQARPLAATTRVQTGFHSFLCWWADDGDSPRPPAPKKPVQRGWWSLFIAPWAVALWFLAAVALPLWEGYLNSAQTYIPDYATPLLVVSWLLGLTFAVQMLLLPLTQRYLLLPILGLVAAFFTVGEITDWLADCYGFQFDGTYGDAVAQVAAFLFFALLCRRFLRDFIPLVGRALWQVLFLALIPIFLFSVYSYLKQNDYFKQRPGSYPAYHETLQNSVWFPNRIKSIDDFFMIDKNNHQE